VPNDRDYEVADDWLDLNTLPLITTDYVIDELFTLFKSRGEFKRALEIGGSLLDDSIVQIESVLREDFFNAWAIVRRHRDKNWSFTDCTSLAVMRRLEIAVAFSFDQHFHQFGSISVVP
jgi:uncharacterized protein